MIIALDRCGRHNLMPSAEGNHMTVLNVLVIPEMVSLKDGNRVRMFTAVGVEHFLAGQGVTEEEAVDALARSIQSSSTGTESDALNPLSGIKPAPADVLALGQKYKSTIMPVRSMGELPIQLAPRLLVKGAA